MLGRRFGGVTCRLASVVDDGDFGITHVISGNDHRPNGELDRRLHDALGTRPPEHVHHGLLVGESATVAALRDVGIPAEAVRAYLEELGLPAHDVHYDLARIRRLALDAIAALDETELASRRSACRSRRSRPCGGRAIFARRASTPLRSSSRPRPNPPPRRRRSSASPSSRGSSTRARPSGS